MWTGQDPCAGGWWAAGDGELSQCGSEHCRLRLVLTAFFPALAIHNGAEVLCMLLVTFQRYCGACFWSVSVAIHGQRSPEISSKVKIPSQAKRTEIDVMAICIVSFPEDSGIGCNAQEKIRTPS
ncbi:putative integral membrane protein [Teratosphaeria destructans]|uniref:Integral membrane protein n=1 Tax=Teratosphaeria destructans TaxID=418781 RepID=A0A9W7SQ41_9PEZI|nr:putative integral membrane protein [Teratosphaeria destructans]